MNLHFQFDPQRMWLQQAEDHCRLALRSTRRCPRDTWRAPGFCGARRRTSSTPKPLLPSSGCWRHDRARAGSQPDGHDLPAHRTAWKKGVRARAGAAMNPRTRTGNLEESTSTVATSRARKRLRKRGSGTAGQDVCAVTRMLPPLLSGRRARRGAVGDRGKPCTGRAHDREPTGCAARPAGSERPRTPSVCVAP